MDSLMGVTARPLVRWNAGAGARLGVSAGARSGAMDGRNCWSVVPVGTVDARTRLGGSAGARSGAMDAIVGPLSRWDDWYACFVRSVGGCREARRRRAMPEALARELRPAVVRLKFARSSQVDERDGAVTPSGRSRAPHRRA